MIVLETRNLTHQYTQGGVPRHVAVQEVSLQIQKGECVAIIGHTGSGKSTLIQHFNGLLKPTGGEVLLDGKSIWENKAATRAARFRVGLCFQYPEYQLFEETVYKDIAFGPKNMKLAQAEIDSRVYKAAEYVGLAKELLGKSPFELSGGEKRRAAIAGVMAMEPEVLVLDEPTAGLDPEGRTRIFAMIQNYRKRTGTTVIFVSHSMEDVAGIAERILVLSQSRLAMSGSVDDIFSRADALRRMELDVPEITALFHDLKERGLPVSNTVYTVEQGRQELLRLWHERGADA